MYERLTAGLWWLAVAATKLLRRKTRCIRIHSRIRNHGNERFRSGVSIFWGGEGGGCILSQGNTQGRDDGDVVGMRAAHGVVRPRRPARMPRTHSFHFSPALRVTYAVCIRRKLLRARRMDRPGLQGAKQPLEARLHVVRGIARVKPGIQVVQSGNGPSRVGAVPCLHRLPGPFCLFVCGS
jgi:hypothetical protein